MWVFFVGYLYGVDAVKTTLIYLLRSFTFSNYKYRRVEDIKFDWKFTMRVADGYGLILNKRRQNWKKSLILKCDFY